MTRGATIPDTVTLHVPFRVVKRGGRKEMRLPEGAPQSRRTDSTLVKALARAFRWKRMLETGEFATIAELAEREGIASSYMTRVLRLTLLAPDIVQMILEGRNDPKFSLAQLLESFSAEWEAQRELADLPQLIQGKRSFTLRLNVYTEINLKTTGEGYDDRQSERGTPS